MAGAGHAGGSAGGSVRPGGDAPRRKRREETAAAGAARAEGARCTRVVVQVVQMVVRARRGEWGSAGDGRRGREIRKAACARGTRRSGRRARWWCRRTKLWDSAVDRRCAGGQRGQRGRPGTAAPAASRMVCAGALCRGCWRGTASGVRSYARGASVTVRITFGVALLQSAGASSGRCGWSRWMSYTALWQGGKERWADRAAGAQDG
ncbi:hypothetical protein DFH08DRAFT_798078 [Mycena albidolilacea]|uniref:Uncharacterized protein n=1 Tax=Mycena albidolilacea TaxID=1033008 RepID=A0AAD7ASP8_9AGAR|nr:hypothetical protein DFH08DRAFT_798078 [Mycena albidolilacea]